MACVVVIEIITSAQFLARTKAKKPSKYRNKRVQLDGIWFDSKRQAARYAELNKQVWAGKIHHLEIEPSFVLAPSVKIQGEARARPAMRVKLDFGYTITATGERIVEDVKSPSTAKATSWRIRQHLMKSVHGIDVRVVK